MGIVMEKRLNTKVAVRGQAEPEGCGGVLPEPYTYTVLCVTLGS